MKLVTIIYGAIALPNFCITSLSEADFESINGNQMPLDTLRDGNEKKNIVQEPKPFHE